MVPRSEESSSNNVNNIQPQANQRKGINRAKDNNGIEIIISGALRLFLPH